MSIQIFSPLTVNKNSSKVITAVEVSTSPPTGKQEKKEREESGMKQEEEERTWKLLIFLFWIYVNAEASE